MKIAIIGFGSIVNNPTDALRLRGEMQLSTLRLPLEFSRISMSGTVSVVVDFDNGVECSVYVGKSARKFHVLDAASDMLVREKTKFANVGFICKDGTFSSHQLVNNSPESLRACNIVKAWLEGQSEFDAAVWSALPPNFQEELGVPFSVDRAASFIAALPASQHKKAVRYIKNAPIETPLKAVVMAAAEAAAAAADAAQAEHDERPEVNN